MSQPQVTRRIKYQEELDLDFGHEVARQPGGEDLYRCIQCGTCSGACPLSIYMDLVPRKIIAMARAGFKDEVLASNTIWLCASCYACTVECPKDIKITDVMYALKREAIRRQVYPKRLPLPVLAEEFYKSVESTGRSNEGRIVTKMFLRTNPWKIFGNAMLGLKLFSRGRMSVRKESMEKGQEQLRKMLQAVDQMGPDACKSAPQATGH